MFTPGLPGHMTKVTCPHGLINKGGTESMDLRSKSMLGPPALVTREG